MDFIDDLLNPSPQERARLADMTAHGRGPRREDGYRGRLGYAQGGTGSWGIAGRAGLLDGATPGGGSGSLFTAQGGAGRWIDPQGRVNYGANADVAALRLGLGGGPVSAEGGMFTAQAGATINRSTAAIGAQANLIEGALTGAGRLWGDDHMIRGGASYGAGLAGRVHYGDDDSDGIPELGFGFDLGPATFDIKSETLGRGYNWLRRQLGSAAGSGAGRAVGGGVR
jgi:hypothetical protein